jgi:alpha-1,6-mannosyltransferase
VWHRDHRFAIGAIILSVGLVVAVGFLGPSAVALYVGPRASFLPSWYVPLHWWDAASVGWITDPPLRPNDHRGPAEWLVSVPIWVAILVGGLGLFIGQRALADGWRPHLRRLFVLGASLSTVTALVPPLTSADVLMYAAYGRLQRLGMSPYDISPAEVFRSQYDAVLTLTERPWQDTPSVYGPITSWTQLAANHLGGENMHDIVFWLQMFALLPFIATCAGVVWLAHGDRDRQARATLFMICNPLLIWAVVAGAHNEALSVMFAVFGLMMMRKSPVLAGLGIGLAGCAKLSIGLWGLAMLWAYRREPKKAALLCLGASVPMVLAYVAWEPTALVQVLRNGGYVSVGSWANPIFRFLDLFMVGWHAKVVVGVISYAMLIAFVWMLSRVVPWTPAPGLVSGQDLRHDPVTIAVRTALLLSVAWLVTSMYTLSWYDLIAWAPLAVLAATRLDWLFVLRGVFLSLAYVPGRSIDISHYWLEATAARVRDTMSPVVQAVVLGVIVHWWWEDRLRRRAGEVDQPIAAAVRGA